ncbi:protein FAM161A [Stigmatopora nigra]
MANAHRNNVLMTSCLKQPVDPHTGAPLASYEREKEMPYSAALYVDNRDDYQENQDEEVHRCMNDKGDASCHVPPAKVCRDRVDLRNIFFSNEEYYRKLEELKKAHLRTMAELESMYHRKLQLQTLVHSPYLLQQQQGDGSQHLRKSRSAAELHRGQGESSSSSSDEGDQVEKGLLFSPKEYIKNMWSDFKLSPRIRHLSTSLPGDRSDVRVRRRTDSRDSRPPAPRVTVPKPFRMTLREAERRRCGIKTRSEVELENAELRRQLEELVECQRKFRASPVPAHVHLPLYGELLERRQEQRRIVREDHHLKTKPFSFLERERLKKEEQQRQQQELQEQQPPEPERVKPFKAKPVPKWIYEAGHLKKEEELHRSIKKQMRAQEMLESAAAPPSTLSKRLAQSKKGKGHSQTFSHQPRINKDVPDLDDTFRRFQKRMERNKEVKPTTVCEPFQLRTAKISHRERHSAEKEPPNADGERPVAEKGPVGSPPLLRWSHAKSSDTANSSLCSSLSGSMELLPAKDTDATKKRHQAVRQALERRRRAEQEEARWTERQKEREMKLQKLVQKRASANDPHLALSQTHNNKLQEFKKQDRQRRKEYQQEIREIEQRVKGRPLLLEQVAQKNAQQAAHKRFADTLQKVDLSEDFVKRKAAAAGGRVGGTRESSESGDPALELIHYQKVLLDNEDQEVGEEDEQDEERDITSPAGSEECKEHHSHGSCTYSDDEDHYSDEEEAVGAKRDEDQDHA